MATTRKREIPAHLIEAVREADQITAALRAAGRPYAAFIFHRDLGRFIRDGMSEAHFRFLTQRFDPGPGWPERKPKRVGKLAPTGRANLPPRRRLPRRERPAEWRPKVLPTGHDIDEGMSGTKFAAVIRARYGVSA